MIAAILAIFVFAPAAKGFRSRRDENDDARQDPVRETGSRQLNALVLRLQYEGDDAGDARQHERQRERPRRGGSLDSEK
jgi:hypothetical protein